MGVIVPHVREFLAAVLGEFGKPYIWDAKGPDSYDCSGLVTASLRNVGGPDWRSSHWTGRLWSDLAEVHELELKPGHLAFYLSGIAAPDHLVDHVEVVLPYGLTVGARGGGHTCISLPIAEAAGREG